MHPGLVVNVTLFNHEYLRGAGAHQRGGARDIELGEKNNYNELSVTNLPKT